VNRIRIAVLASGSGTTFENLVVRSRDGRLPVDIVRLVVSRPDCGAVSRAERLGVECVVVPWRNDQRAFDAAVAAAVDMARPDLVCMAGFVKLWNLPPAYAGKVMNVHPALLPAFGGRGMWGHHVHEAVVASRAGETGCSVHFADDQYDHGPVILQRKVRVDPRDTADDVAARVQAAEREAYPEAIALFAAGRLAIEGGRVRVLPPR
jgi:formyltetrahydrofolate-dependent phosphoribosylglycinamide formyltransferase